MQQLKVVHQKLLPKQLFNAAAEMAFHFTLAFFPLLISLLSIAVSVLAQLDLNIENIRFVLTALPPELRQQVAEALNNVSTISFKTETWLPFIVGLWAGANGAAVGIKAIGVAEETMSTLSMKAFWFTRLLGLFLILTIGFLLGLTSIFFFLLNLFIDYADVLFNLRLPVWLQSGGEWLIMIVVVSGITGLMYWLAFKLHKQTVPIRASWFGGLSFACVWAVSSYGFSLYLRFFGFNSALYGTLGSIAILMLWLYISSAAWIVGAKITQLAKSR